MQTRERHRYRNFSPGKVRIHPFKRVMAGLKRLLPPACHFTFLGLPPPGKEKRPQAGEARAAFVSVKRGIACEIGANLNADGTYIPELTMGAGSFIETRFLQKQRCFPRIKSLSGTVVSLVIEGQVNYYRWLMETLPRMHLIQSQRLEYDWIYAHQDQPFHRDTVRLLGCDLSRVVNSSQCRFIQAQDLIVPRLVDETEPWIVPWLRQQFLPLARPWEPAALPRRIYITRRKTTGRRVVNEAELMRVLEPLGFVALALEDLEWLHQVALFQNAAIIIAPHGAGLGNLVFASTNALVIELIAESYRFTYFPEICRQLGITHHLLFCKPSNPSYVQASDITVSVERISELLVNGKP